ncbi:MAG: hypothetical protein JEY71_02570 [Sphaerochaeta sp.]|nr:hypothetical protein [Sphaerochaeta sp.]
MIKNQYLVDSLDRLFENLTPDGLYGIGIEGVNDGEAYDQNLDHIEPWARYFFMDQTDKRQKN